MAIDFAKWLRTHRLVGNKWVPINTPTASKPEVVQPPTGPDTTWQDATYNDTQSSINTGLQNLGAYLTGQGTNLQAEYGITGPAFDPSTFDPNNPGTFTVDWEHVDVNNPFSRAALMKKTHEANERGNTNSYAARGQLYSGALQNAQNDEGFRYAGAQDSLNKDFASQWGGLFQQWLTGRGNATTQGIANVAAAQERHRGEDVPGRGYLTGGAAAPGSNVRQYRDSGIGGQQPAEYISPAVKAYLKNQKKTDPGKSKKPKRAGRTGGAYAPS